MGWTAAGIGSATVSLKSHAARFGADFSCSTYLSATDWDHDEKSSD